MGWSVGRSVAGVQNKYFTLGCVETDQDAKHEVQGVCRELVGPLVGSAWQITPLDCF